MVLLPELFAPVKIVSGLKCSSCSRLMDLKLSKIHLFIIVNCYLVNALIPNFNTFS